MDPLKNINIAVIGLGYVGLPLAVEFGKRYTTIGFDINEARLNELRSGQDNTLEVNAQELSEAKSLVFTSTPADIQSCNFFIVTVPTPINEAKQPDLGPLLKASETVGKALKFGDIVVYESTVFPGATEGHCVPILEQFSGLRFNEDFFCGYSPERINPGDKVRRLKSIIKITSGSTPTVADFVDQLYSSIITAGTYKASSIRVAEAAKVIENTQRDVNIALINEFALIFKKVGIDTQEVLEAAGTKWNFLSFRPGLVGGHCIGVDPYYLTYMAQSLGYNPEIILAGRRLNDSMGSYVATQLVKAMIKKHISVNGSRILVLGLTFKENCSDIRNTKVVDVVHELQDYGAQVDCYDPWSDPQEVEVEYSIVPIKSPKVGTYDAVLIAVAHKEFVDMGVYRMREFCKPNNLIYDLKYILPMNLSDLRL